MKKKINRSVMALLLVFTIVFSTILPAFAASDGTKVGLKESGEWYDSMGTTGVNRELSHSQFIPYEDEEAAWKSEKSALDDVKDSSAYYQLLSQKNWDFALVTTPDKAKEKDAGYLAAALSDQDKNAFQQEFVPQAWQTYKDVNGNFKYDDPIYTNSIYPWGSVQIKSDGSASKKSGETTDHYQKIDYDTPHAPTEYNPVGYYRTTFKTPTDWNGREMFVSFQSVSAGYYLYVNGKYVGYSTDSYTAHDFNLTPYLNAAGQDNTIALKVYRWTIGSYLENQDMIQQSGIFRDVYLYSKDEVEIRDFFAKTKLAQRNSVTSDATVDLDIDVKGLHNAASGDYTVEATLKDLQTEEPVADTLTKTVSIAQTKSSKAQTTDEFLSKIQNPGTTVSGQIQVKNPKKWFPDTPNLYMLMIQLKNSEGKVLETVAQRVGFREIYKVNINDKGQEQMQITGKKIMIRGTNRHDNDLKTGRAVSQADIIKDLTLMKQYNINAIRTSHYQNDNLLYDLADEMGLYICAEVNIESHYAAYTDAHTSGSPVIPCGSNVWVPQVLDRTKNMVESLKNHSSIIIWSLGNEATYTSQKLDDNYCFWVSSQWILNRDPSRLRKYERESDNYQRRYVKASNTTDPMDIEQRKQNIVDIHSTQYPQASEVEAYATNPDYKMPYIESEYIHSMGQSLGGFNEFWKLDRKYPNVQGGFIWDWIDQSLESPVPNDTVTYTCSDTKTGTEARLSSGVEIVDGRNGTKAIKNGYASVTRGSALQAQGDALTLEAWIKPVDANPSHDMGIFSTGDNGIGFKINGRGTSKYFEFFVDGWQKGVGTANLPADFADGKWHQLVGVVKADKTLHIYWDGAELTNTGAASTTATAPFDSATTDLTIGLDSANAGTTFSGSIDCAHIYQKALTDAEITSTSRTSADAGVVYWMDFNASELKSKTTDYHWLDSKLGANTYWGYGGDWMDYGSNADAFCADAIVYADRTPTAKLNEVKKVQQQINFYDDGEASKGKVRVVNEFENTSLDKFDISWKLTEDTKQIGGGALNLSTAALSEETAQLTLPAVTPKAGSVYLLEFSVKYKQDNSFAKAGDEFAFEQIPLDFKAPGKAPVDITKVGAFTSVDDQTADLKIAGTTDAGKTYSLTMNKTTGVITNYSLDGATVLENGPVPSYWRAQTYNDTTNKFPAALRNADKTMKNVKVNVVKNQNNKLISVTISEDLQVDASNYVTYDIYGNGAVVVSNQFVPHSNFAPGNNGQAALPKVGMRMEVAPGYDQIEYFGRGPDENYCDRNTGSKLGVYKSTVDEQFQYKYLKPQENGNRTDVRWTSLTDSQGNGLMVTAENTMETEAQHYTAEELNPAGDDAPYNSSSAYRHAYQVPMRADTIWSIDYMQRGVSNTAFFGHVPLAPYRLDTDKTYSHAFIISPVTAATDKMATSKTAVLPSSINYPITNIKVNGTTLKGFDPSKYTYSMEISATETPVVTAVTALSSMSATVEMSGNTATVKSGSLTYTINFSRVNNTYVSDLDKYNWTVTAKDQSGNVTADGDLTTDKTPAGNSISVLCGSTATKFAKGLSFTNKNAAYSSRRHMTLEIPIEGRGFERFKTFAGMDTSSGNWGYLKIDVKTTDGKTVSVLPSTGWMNNTYAAKEVDVVVPANAKSIVFEIETDNSSNTLDFADARFVQAAKSDKSALSTLYNTNKDKVKGNYTDASWKAFTDALTKAKTVLDNMSALQDEVDTAKNTLDSAVKALVIDPGITVDNSALLALYNANKDKVKGNYTDASWKAFTDALANAVAVLNSSNATQAGVDQATAALKAALAALTESSSNNPSNNNSSSSKNSSNSSNTQPSPSNVTTTQTAAGGTVTTVSTQPDAAPVVTGNQSNVAVTVPADVASVISSATAAHPANVTVSAPTASLVEQLNNTAVARVGLTVSVPSAVANNTNANARVAINIAAAVLQTAKTAKKDVTVEVVNSATGSAAYSWTFSGANLTNSAASLTNVNLAITVAPAKNDTAAAAVTAGNTSDRKPAGVVLNFAHSGLLPATAYVKVYVGNQPGVTPFGKMYMYYFNKVANILEQLPQSEFTVDALGYVTVPVSHCSEYVLLPKPATKAYAVKSDTWTTVGVKAGKTYTYAMTVSGNAVPSFTVGNSKAFTAAVKRFGNKYYVTVKAVGTAGTMTAVYSTLPGQKPVVMGYAAVAK
ncbi:MAG TPA: glycoside hydrolase family 2 TIM barrel-domain containing protein [Caproiciproducens sp.]|nr:glycoside hydrolase family 2 TIM barrel-domain containing protein [Caproiciproducens sp.]